MQVVINLTIDIDFDMESDGMVHPESAVPAARVAAELEACLQTSMEECGVLDDLVEAATNSSSWCVNSLSVTTKIESTSIGND
jgi:hypothetical protein